MFRVGRGLYFIIPLLALVIAGCSASDFTQPVTEFSKASRDAATSFQTYDDSLKQVFLDRAFRSVLGTRSIMPKPGQCRLDADNCSLVVVRGGRTDAFNPDSIENSRRLMAGVIVYTNSLEAIVTSKSESEIKSATEKVKNNLHSLARNGDTLNKALNGSSLNLEEKLARFSSPVASAVEFGLAKYAETVKLEALRSATARMDSIFPELTTLFNQVATTDFTEKRKDLDKAFTASWVAYRDDRGSRTKLEALRRAVELYDKALATKPESVFNDLQQAHAELTKALHDPRLNFENLWPLIQRITDEAVKLAEISKAFQQAAKSKSAG